MTDDNFDTIANIDASVVHDGAPASTASAATPDVGAPPAFLTAADPEDDIDPPPPTTPDDAPSTRDEG